MLSKEDFAVIQALVGRGVYQQDIAQKLGVHPKTVGRALKRGAAPRRERACHRRPRATMATGTRGRRSPYRPRTRSAARPTGA
jgi:IS30 family transposase